VTTPTAAAPTPTAAASTHGADAPAKPRKHKTNAVKSSQQITKYFQPRQKSATDKDANTPINMPPKYKLPTPPTVEEGQMVTEPLARLTVSTLNVQGLQTSKVNVRDITLGEYGLVPDILILTETKSKPTHAQQVWLKLLKKRYHAFHSLVPTDEQARARVTILVSKKISEMGTIRMNKLPPHTQGYLLHVTVENPYSNPLHVVGVYCPPQPGQQDHRQQLYDACTTILCAAPETHNTAIIAGDFNAALYPTDRRSNMRSQL
jgi:endonuclease/exonuclease/phosphatase family metal-dependent hydrolase